MTSHEQHWLQLMAIRNQNLGVSHLAMVIGKNRPRCYIKVKKTLKSRIALNGYSRDRSTGRHLAYGITYGIRRDSPVASVLDQRPRGRGFEPQRRPRAVA